MQLTNLNYIVSKPAGSNQTIGYVLVGKNIPNRVGVSGTEKMGVNLLMWGEQNQTGLAKSFVGVQMWGYSINPRVRCADRNRFPSTGWGAFRGVRPFSVPVLVPDLPESVNLKRLYAYVSNNEHKIGIRNNGLFVQAIQGMAILCVL